MQSEAEGGIGDARQSTCEFTSRKTVMLRTRNRTNNAIQVETVPHCRETEVRGSKPSLARTKYFSHSEHKSWSSKVLNDSQTGLIHSSWRSHRQTIKTPVLSGLFNFAPFLKHKSTTPS